MKKPKCDPDAGFSLLEVLVAILIVTFFTAVAMQMVVISAAFKAKAKVYTTATNLIQKDLENIRNLAIQYKFPTLSSVPSAGTITLSSTEGLLNGEKIQFQGTPDVYTLTISGATTTISPVINKVPASNATTVSNTSCSATSANSDKGLANRLMTSPSLVATVSGSATTISGIAYKPVLGANPYVIPTTQKKLWLMRNDSYNFTGSVAPYDVLRVNYLVVKDNNGSPSTNIIAKLSSEVIPYASFQCIK
ncbi:type II secretion system protein [Anabaena sphaerica FACHB-251]|uniref:Type II secretion system protein n=1 Tax=Anabaena sphaerica FACHB-251 TaxID=2692883 RepID=A0A926ZZB4_9NOST|nr:type II secretion system protein [Anabaena sphaerica]MBD2293557.1 type II secretion system protein [Anabaena sphaerica FACHB-251]